MAVNLAATLAKQDHDVALFDCDIDCPNVTRVLQISEGPVEQDGRMVPSQRFGVKVMSMAFFQQNEEEAIIWRGPMIHNAINQFLQMTNWGEPDYMVVDLPPGTSDAPLTGDADVEPRRVRDREHAAGVGSAGCQAVDQYDPEDEFKTCWELWRICRAGCSARVLRRSWRMRWGCLFWAR